MRNIRRLGYLDALSGSKVRKRTIEHMNNYYDYGNPRDHTYQGRFMNTTLEKTKHNISCIYEFPETNTIDRYDVRFLQSTTDALMTWYDMICYCNPMAHIVVSSCNSAVEIDIITELVANGKCTMTILDVDYKGKISMNQLYGIINTATVVSINATNNMTGIIEDIRAISNACRDHGAIFFSDTSNHSLLKLSDISIDGFVSTSYKINGPAGSCYLIYRRSLCLNYQFRRQGTLNVAIIEGHAEALRWYNKYSHKLYSKYIKLRHRLRSRLRLLPIPIVQYTGQRITFESCIVLYSNITDEYDPRITLMSILSPSLNIVTILNDSYGVIVGVGELNSRVLVDITGGIGTLSDNCIRISFQYCTINKDIDKFIDALNYILELDDTEHELDSVNL